MPNRLDTSSANFEAEFGALLAAKREVASSVDDVVAAILDDVRTRGDGAVLDYTKKFDGLDIGAADMRVTGQEFDAAEKATPDEQLTALRAAGARITAYHTRQMPNGDLYADEAGVQLGYRWTAISSVGVYTPGGKAAYPSSVLMTAIPAKVAGVDRLVMTVPAPGGLLNPLVLVAARQAGIDEVYKIGGAQAVAALAYGTQSIPAVNKIAGPGNAYVAAAKRQVFGVTGIDMEAGPSEILVVADGQNNPEWIAADLLSQAEHDESAQAILITDDGKFASAVIASVDQILETLGRSAIAGKSWADHGVVIVVGNLDEAPPLVDRIAPEHLELAVADPDGMAAKIRNAGAIFLGRFTPEAIGDYIAGPSHVLPTGRSPRFASGLSVFDFLKRTSMVRCDEDSIRAVGPHAVTLAEAEGLGAHAQSVKLRLGTSGS
ncbi:MAG: histidinol dehydrogenase [Alphaproteobacteria bacterium]|nr:histidinol dehydrogenase [Alphaproteobacteria bacterium]MBT5860723.1 histidinol dehydrogenase [Alphaproteobacteria bacterium]